MNDAAPNTNLAVTPKTSRDDATARQSFAETEGLVSSSSMVLISSLFRRTDFCVFKSAPRPDPARFAPAALTSTTSDGSEYPLLPCAPHATTRYCRRRAGCPSGFKTPPPPSSLFSFS
jgi:hypothetical protein